MPANPDLFFRELQSRILVLDGAMGTTLNTFQLSVAEDYAGQENNHEILNLRRPDVIGKIHAGYYEAGADAVETNTFSATRISQADFGPEMVQAAKQLNIAAARLAREVADDFTRREPGKPRFVVGACGPTNKMITVGTPETVLGYDAFYESYLEQVEGLIEGGADAILFETAFDLMALKTGIIAAGDAFKRKGVRLPLMAQVAFVKPTDDAPANTMLCGTDMATLIATLEDFDHLDVLGMNCATGPEDMSPHIHHLCRHSNKRVSVLPNAGLPRMEKGKAHFPMDPEALKRWIVQFVEEAGVNIIGGCCGTHAGHIAAMVKAIGRREPKRRTPQIEHCASSMTTAVPLKQDSPPLLVGERTNSKGSKKFNKLMLADDLDGMAKMGVEQVGEGAHVLDVCVAEVGRKDAPTMNRVVERFRQSITIPLMIDTTEIDCVEQALQRYPGKAIINSINLEDGRERMDKVVRLARRYNAAMVALTIDEDKQEGMARTVERKVAVARRIHDICTKEFGVKPQDLLFDVLTFTLATGRPEDREAGVNTLKGIKAVKEALPGVGTILGLSNISFGFKPAARVVLNSVFMHHALKHGLDAAIVHVSQILPLARLDERQVKAAERLVFNEWADGKDPLQEFLALFADSDGKKNVAVKKVAGTIEEVLKQRIIDGDRPGIEADLDKAREKHSPLDIINNILLDGMKVVGDLFGSGRMQLPFVLQSAETMKSAVAHLEKFMEKVEGQTKGRLVLATVKGDVHDIGKNLVDIILTNNGYTVYNIGIKQPVNAVLDAAERHKADAIGLSGLLVKSTVVMKEDLEEMNRRGRLYPVMLGGAALTRKYVEDDLTETYRGNVFYCRDAFDGLHVMDRLMAGGVRGPESAKSEAFLSQVRTSMGGSAVAAGDDGEGNGETLGGEQEFSDRPDRVGRGWVPPKAPAGARSDVGPAPTLPEPPFWGSRVVTDLSLDEVYRFINKKYLFRQQWQFSKGALPHEEFLRREREVVEPIFERVTKRWRDEGVLQPRVVYGYFPCNSDGDDLVVFHPDTGKEWVRFTFPRQPTGKYLCIADFFLPVSSGKRDVLAAHCVTVGAEASRKEKEIFAANDYREYLYLHGLSVETTEALAEYWHKVVRKELGIAGDDSPNLQQLFQQKYRGSRYSFGYPACPNLEDQRQLFELLQPERIGVGLTEEFQLEPEQSTSAVIVHHPAAKYFNIR
jgi:5-methyltetrahydrofolate--homocysteine methyltransferase